MKVTVQYERSKTNPFDIKRGFKQGCVLTPTFYGIFFALLLKHAFGTSTEGVYLRTRPDGQLFNLARMKAKSKVIVKTIRDMLFAGEDAVISYTKQELQCLIRSFSHACNDLELTISLKKDQCSESRCGHSTSNMYR